MATTTTTEGVWWRDAVVYQVYVKSFADSDGDGIGDIDGITSRLDHIAGLGVDALWLNPCYVTPDCDGGYDVADYLRIDDAYGGNEALDRLLAAAHARGLRLLLDIVPNHCSVDHEWFRAALGEAPGGPNRARFLFRDGKGPAGNEPPNNWASLFGGPAWTRVTEVDGAPGQWYLHLFDTGQPDFDWTNPDVHAYFEHVLRFWFDRGVDGFRIDVAHGLVKAEGLPDTDGADPSRGPMLNQPGVHAIYRDWRRLADGYLPERELPFVGEAWAPSADAVAAFVSPDELHETFFFDLTRQRWSAPDFRATVDAALAALANLVESRGGSAPGVFAWTLNNHDIHRSVSRYGLLAPTPIADALTESEVVRPRGDVDVELGQIRARAATLFLLALPGPVFLYQGEELGLPEVTEIPGALRQDPMWRRSGGTDVGRDGCRVPLPWTDEAPTFGFSPPDATSPPWLPQPAEFSGLAASVQEVDPTSTLALYRRTLALRRELFEAGDRTIEWRDAGRDDVLAFRRGTTLSVTVFGAQPFEVPAGWGSIALTSESSLGRLLPGGSGGWIVP